MRQYHEETIYQRGSLLGHSLDWGNRPITVKNYKNRSLIPIAAEASIAGGFFDVATSWPPRYGKASKAAPHATGLCQVLQMSAGITSPRWEDGRLLGLRANPSAGALYPCELYVAASEVQGVADGLYHYSPEGPGWHFLWEENLAAFAATALGGRPARLTFFITSLLWRSLWKYGSRAYRYCLLDAGHLLANLELALALHGWQPRTTANFADNALSVLLSLADQSELPLVAVRAGGAPGEPGASDIDLPPLDLQMQPLSRREGRDFAVLNFHQQSQLAKPKAEPVWQGITLKAGVRSIDLPKPAPGGLPLARAMSSRRSQRVFAGKGLSLRQLGQLLSCMMPMSSPVMATVVCGANCEAGAGTHLYLPVRHQLLPRSLGQDWRGVVAEACLSQNFMAKASAQIILWADLAALEEQVGNRAYRQAMLAAGRVGQRCYLACQALGLNCCGIGAFYDEDLAAINGMPERAQPLYVLALG